jgi:transcriptional regulator with XRE-family HTH domain
VPKLTKPDMIEQEVVRLLAARREKVDVSKNVLAQRTGLSRAAIRLIEKRERKPTLHSLLRIAEGLGVELWKVIQAATETLEK